MKRKLIKLEDKSKIKHYKEIILLFVVPREKMAKMETEEIFKEIVGAYFLEMIEDMIPWLQGQ